MTKRPMALVCVLVLAAVVLTYGPTLSYGLYWDDFEVLRPWSTADVLSTFTGAYRPWDPSVAFYRPLTAVYYALISTLWGFNAVPMHVIPLAGIATLAWLTVLFVWRETDDVKMAAIAGVLTVTHPELTSSIGPWIANQYHTFMAIALVAALLIWQRHRDTSTPWWWRVAPWLIAAAWFKEDGLLLPLAFAALPWCRARMRGEVTASRLAPWLTLGALTIGLILWRSLWLTTAYGYGLREPADMLANFLRAPRYVLLLQVGPGVVAWPAMVAKGVVLAAAVWVLVRARHSASATLIVVGGVVMLATNLPLAMVSSEGRWHLVGWGAVLLTSGTLGAVIARAPRVGWAVALAVVVALSASGVERLRTFAPCTDDWLARVHEMSTMEGLPMEMRDWMTSQSAACHDDRYAPFETPMRALTWPPPR
ncbi:MAG: hypothetical protein KAY59_09650 [Acidobacteria bacterium]|nr:hypothetical protein [Acidobacteriota bacterium]MBP8274684.1 hypothetical protein [Acidobacteriota bacterium]